MPGKWKEVVRLRFKGDRYRGHALDLSALNKLSQFQKMVAETAKELWRDAHPGRNLPRHFEERTRLCLRKIEDGSATLPLEVYIEEPNQPELWEPEPTEIQEAINITYDVFEAVKEDRPLPGGFPKSLISEFAKWGQGFKEDEEVEIQPPDKKPTRVTLKHTERIADFLEEFHEDQVDVTGEVLEADVRQKQFQLWVDKKTKVLVSFSEEQETEVTTALKEHKSLKIQVKGQGEVSPLGKLLKIKEVDELKMLPVGDLPFDRSARPIGQILEEMAKKVPKEEWDKIPNDLTDNLDHYLYGTPKR